MDLNIDQPISALASAAGGSMRGIVRISGSGVREVLESWFVPDDNVGWMSAKIASAHNGFLRLDSGTDQVDCRVQVLFWPTSRSYTGQPLIEIHAPGAPCLLEAVLGESYRHGARPARPGEFTLRAFLAGKLDLLQAEAVLGVIDAQNQQELQTALSQLAGGVSGKLGQLRRDLLELLADLEAGLDFVDEDIEFVSRHDVITRLSRAYEYIAELLQQTTDRMQARVRQKVVLAGLPNAGKSTLFNRLVGNHSALVSPEQGTTRDFLLRPVTWGDLSFDLVDTAGWEQVASGISAAAQDHRMAQLGQSDLVVWCSSADLDESGHKLDEQLYCQARQTARSFVRLLTKIDLDENPTQFITGLLNDELPLAVSGITAVGLEDLYARLRTDLCREKIGSGQWLGVTAARCRETLERTAASLLHATEAAQAPRTGDELIAVDLRDALDHLGVILGVIYTDDILDRVFSKFCIGK